MVGPQRDLQLPQDFSGFLDPPSELLLQSKQNKVKNNPQSMTLGDYEKNKLTSTFYFPVTRLTFRVTPGSK